MSCTNKKHFYPVDKSVDKSVDNFLLSLFFFLLISYLCWFLFFWYFFPEIGIIKKITYEVYMVANDIWWELVLAGAIGAFVRICVDSGCLVLPKFIDSKLVLGFIGPVFVGGFIGFIVDGSLLGASMGGFIGADMLDRFTAIYSTQFGEKEVK